MLNNNMSILVYLCENLDLNVSPVLAKKRIGKSWKKVENVEKKVRKEYHIEKNMNLRGKRPIWGKGDIIHRSK